MVEISKSEWLISSAERHCDTKMRLISVAKHFLMKKIGRICIWTLTEMQL
jgi:hypothetical protein